MSQSKIIRLLVSTLLIPLGAVLILLNISGNPGLIITKIGLSLLITGFVSTFHELVIKKSEIKETSKQVSEIVEERLRKSPIHTNGIKLLTENRRGFDGYYDWITATNPQDLFFAGRSVIHRIDSDVNARELGPLEDIFARKLREQSEIKILFIDPRSNLIDRLAQQEGRKERDFYRDLSISVGICIRLYHKLKDFCFTQPCELDIRVYDDIPYFAYHKEDERVIVGFYFSKLVGSSTAAYEIIGKKTGYNFNESFLSLFQQAKDNSLLHLPSHQPQIDLNIKLYEEIYATLVNKLSEREVEELHCIKPEELKRIGNP